MALPLPKPIEQFLAAFVARRRRLALVKALAVALAVAMAITLAACLLDRLLQLPAIVRGTLLVGTIGAVAWLMARPVRALAAGPIDWTLAAEQVEALQPQFAQRLITVTSQLQSPDAHRGSPALLQQIAGDASAVAITQHPRALLTRRQISRPINTALAAALVSVALAFVPWLNYPQLLARFTRPWANIAPVTTTQLSVDPGDTQVLAGKPLRVMVTAVRAGDSPPLVHVKQSGGWSRQEMTLAAPTRFAADLPPMERDAQYYVTAGDARSSTFDVQVLAQPQLVELRATVTYPSYLNRPAKTPKLTDGRLDVPAGSEVSLSLAASEPLSAAIITPRYNDPPIAAAESVDPSVRVAKLTVKRDLSAAITLKSQRGVVQVVAQPLQIKAIPDRPPTVRLVAPTEELRLSPLDVLQTAAVASDDYALEQVQLQVRLNDRPPTTQPIALGGRPQQWESAVEVDLAALGAAVGDLLQVQLIARDGAGQSRSSDTLRAIVSPRSFDLNDYARQLELRAAARLAADLLAQLTLAHDHTHQSAESIGKEGDKALAGLAAAAQTAPLLVPPLQRAAARADQRGLGDTLARWADLAEQARATAAELAEQRQRAVDPNAIHGVLDQLIDRVKPMNEQLAQVIRASAATAVRDDLAAASAIAPRAQKAGDAERDRLAIAARRLEASAAETAKTNQLPLDAGGLQQAIASAASLIDQGNVIDFTEPAREWAGQLQQRSPGNRLATQSRLTMLALPSRLATASAMEAVRPSADFGRARDLTLAGRAASAIEAEPAAAAEYPGALRDLQAEHRLRRMPGGDERAIRAAARAARDKMRRWAGEPEKTTDEQQALDAAAAVQDKQFDQPATTQPRPSSAVAQSIEAAKRIESLRQQQADLAKETTELAKQPLDTRAAQKKLADLAAQQQAIADAVKQERAKPEPTEPADDPTQAIAAARRALTELRSANNVVRQAPNDAARLDSAKQVDSAAVEAASARLARLSPTADDAQRQIDDQVVGGVRQLQQEARSNDAGAVQRRSGEVDRAIAEALKKLNDAEEKLADRDALAAAESATNDAAEAMQDAAPEPPANEAAKGEANDASAKAPPGKQSPASAAKSPAQRASEAKASLQQASASQARAAAALAKASDRAAMQSGAMRVRELPGIEAAVSPLAMLADVPAAGGSGDRPRTPTTPAAREWGRLKLRDESNQTAASPAGDPPGYEAPLRAYFEALGKEK